MRSLVLTRTAAISAVAGVLLLAGAGTGVGLWLHSRPVLHVASSAQECISAPDHVASLFSDDQNTLIRISNLDYSDLHVLRIEPAVSLPGMFDTLLALSGDSRRLAYVTATDELMNGARLQYLDVASPQAPHLVADVPTGLAPIRPAWSPGGDQLAYVIGRAASADRPAAFEVWSARGDGSRPAQKVSELPLDVFARGHTASLCWTPAGQIGLLQGVESAHGQVGPSPLSGANSAASAPRTQPSPSPSASPNGSPCGVPVFSQNDPSWRDLIMQAGGDAIGGFGCAVTSTTMLLNYYGAVMSPADLNTCLGSAADPIYWTSAPACTSGKVQGGERTDFSWDGLDAFLKAGKPVIVGMLRGITGSHFVVVTQGGGGEADSYRITDPWDGTTTKTLGSYTNVGYNPRWLVSYDGAGKNCGRLVPATPVVTGFHDGGTYRGGVTVTVPGGSGGSTTVQTPNGNGGPNPPSPQPSAAPSSSPSTSPSTSATPTTSPTATPKPRPSPTGKPTVWHVNPGARLTFTDEGVYQIFFRHPGNAFPPRFSILKFTIDRTAPVLSLNPLDPHQGPVQGAIALRTLAFSAADSTGPVLDRPGKLRLGAIDTLSGVERIEYQLDGGAPVTYSDDVSFGRALVVPTAGPHSITFRATDIAGNVAELTDQPFQVMDTIPTPSPSGSPTPTATATATPTRRPTAPPATQPPTATPTPAPTPTPTAFQVTATLTSSPSDSPPPFCGPFTGPAMFTVTGQISNAGGAGTVTYHWLHNGAAGPALSVALGQGGAQSVSDSVSVPLPPGAVSGSVTVQLQLVTAPGTSSSPLNLICQQD